MLGKLAELRGSREVILHQAPEPSIPVGPQHWFGFSGTAGLCPQAFPTIFLPPSSLPMDTRLPSEHWIVPGPLRTLTPPSCLLG